jgi:hypothetical protein
MPSWIPWLFLAVLLVLPALAAFIGDEPPDNGIVQVQEDEPRRDPDADLAVTAGRKAMKAVRVTLSR